MSFNTALGGVLESEITRSYNSLSGTDIRACIGQLEFTEIQGISYSVTREKAPIYTMGSADCRAYARNKRGIAGQLVWINFDRHALLNLFARAGGKFVSNTDDIRPQFQTDGITQLDQTALFTSALVRAVGPNVGATLDQIDNTVIGEVGQWKAPAQAWYADQILPFDVTLAGVNEIGASATMKIYGVEILNEGNGMSIDDTVNESQATFVARAVTPWTSVKNAFESVANGPSVSR